MSNSLYHTSQDNTVQRGYNAPGINQSSQDSVIRSTTNYNIFKLDPRNRPINSDKLEKLYDSVAKVNLLREFPIVVTPDLYVMDGQHRLKVAEALGVSIYYIVSTKATIEHITMTTDAVSKWSTENYLHRWCVEGKLDYLMLREFWKSNDFLTLNTSMNLCHYGDRYGMNAGFRQGEYKCNDLPFAREVANALREWSKHVKFWKEVSFINAVTNLTGNVKYNHKQMMAKMEYLSTKMVKCTDTESYIAMMNPLYNHRVRRENWTELRKLNSNESDWRPDRRMKKAA